MLVNSSRLPPEDEAMSTSLLFFPLYLETEYTTRSRRDVEYFRASGFGPWFKVGLIGDGKRGEGEGEIEGGQKRGRGGVRGQC